VSGSASSVTCEPSNEIVSPVHSFRYPGCCQSPPRANRRLALPSPTRKVTAQKLRRHDLDSRSVATRSARCVQVRDRVGREGREEATARVSVHLP